MQKWLGSIRRYRYYRGSSLLAPIINLIFAELLLFVIGYLWFVQRTKIPLLSLILTLIIMALLTAAILLQQRKSFQKKKVEVRRKVGRDYLVDHMKQLDSEEFKWQVTRLLLKLEGISDIRDQQHFLETTLHGRKTAIGIYHTNFDEEVPHTRLTEFLNQAKLEGYLQALFITSGSFSDSCRAVAEKKSATRVQLLSLEDLLNRMELTGMFPDEKTIDALINKEINSREKKLEILKKEILMPKRIRAYLGYALLLFVLSRLFKSFSTYYVLISVIFLLLAALTWFIGLKNQKNPGKRDSLLDPPATGGR